MSKSFEQQVTSTGWRIVGAPAVSLLSATSTLDAAPGDDDHVVFAAQFRGGTWHRRT